MERVGQLNRRAFTLLELLVVLGILVILAGILVPYIYRAREKEQRTICMDNLRKLGYALALYGKDNRDELPRVIYDSAKMPHAYTAFTGADAADAFAPGSTVSPNDVTASLWLLLRRNYITSEYTPVSSVFICPSSGDEVDPIQDAQGQPSSLGRRSNFRSRSNLSYSYACPFSDAAGYGLKSDFLPKDFVLLADKNPGNVSARQNAAGAQVNDPPLKMAIANSRNHSGAGQNVLFGDMHVEFRETPYCGVGGDNIYTALAPTPIVTGKAPEVKVPGHLGRDVVPAWQSDSYLTPAQGDDQARVVQTAASAAPASAPATTATTQAAPVAQ